MVIEVAADAVEGFCGPTHWQERQLSCEARSLDAQQNVPAAESAAFLLQPKESFEELRPVKETLWMPVRVLSTWLQDGDGEFLEDNFSEPENI